MKKKSVILKVLLLISTHVIVAVLTLALSVTFLVPRKIDKLSQLKALIMQNYVGEWDETTLEDGAAAGMVAATGDRWSYYIPASQYQALMESHMNTGYVGVGITISPMEGETTFQIVSVTPNGSADEQGVEPEDILVAVNGEDVTNTTSDKIVEMIRGEEGTNVMVTVRRGEETLDFVLTRKSIPVIVAEGKMLEGNIGLVTIANFNDRCASETIAAIDSLVAQGAKGIVFDVRGNPGGSVEELVQILDHLLPEGVLFRSIETGSTKEDVRYSDADCIRLPMSVIVNGDSYSAAEFFAACLQEKQWATVVGERTTGKGHYQNTIRLSDGSAVNLSTGKYFTPNGVNLTELGGLTPDVLAQVDKQTAANIYAQLVPAEEDPQIQGAVSVIMQ